MAGTLRGMLSKIGTTRGDRRVALGLSGKHPSFDDHFEQYSPGADRLPAAAHLLYEGINRNLDAGSWNKLGADKRLAEFNHSFLWHSTDSDVVGRLRASSDAVGRDLYPLVFTAECWNVPIEEIVTCVLPGLDALLTTRDVKSRAVLLEAMESARQTIEQMLRTEDVARSTPDGDGLAQLADSPEMGPLRLGMYRFLYRLESESPASLARSFNKRRGDAHAVQMRLPPCAPTLREAMVRWSGCLQDILGRDVPWMIEGPDENSWIDIVVGQPTPEHMFLLLSSAEAVTTQIPYAMEPEFQKWADETIAGAESRRRSATPSAAGTVAGPTGESPPNTVRRDAGPAPTSRFIFTAVVAIGAVAAVALLAIHLLHR